MLAYQYNTYQHVQIIGIQLSSNEVSSQGSLACFHTISGRSFANTLASVYSLASYASEITPGG